MTKTLKDISVISSGVFAKTYPEGEIIYLQSRHFDVFGKISGNLEPELSDDGKIHKHYLKKGDILFAAKGNRNFAVSFDEGLGKAVASSNFLIIKVKEKNVLPEFIAWFLNQSEAQQTIKGGATGSNLPSVSKAVLESLAVPIPSLETQQKIIKIQELRLKEIELKQKIESLRQIQISQYLTKALEETYAK